MLHLFSQKKKKNISGPSVMKHDWQTQSLSYKQLITFILVIKVDKVCLDQGWANSVLEGDSSIFL